MLGKLWIQLRSSLWFVPTLLVVAAVILAFALIELDIYFDSHLQAEILRPILGASADGARAMLAAIATSMITVAGVAFSITIVTLSLASTQYTPRILRNFMRDRANQAVLGAFVSIFTYCLIVLRGIRSPSEGAPFVPLFAVFVGVLLALLSIGCLIFFIHHVAASIQASTILNVVAGDTAEAIDKLFPDELQEGADSVVTPPDDVEWQTIEAPRNGYVQMIDVEDLHAVACDEGLLLRLDRVAGDFAITGAPLLAVAGSVNEEIAHRLQRTFAIGEFRTLQQDATFGFRQIVDIALKALSPGVNDTSTAVTCVDYLSALLLQLAQRRITSKFTLDEGKARVFAPPLSFRHFTDKTFDQIRLSALGNVTILLQLICTIQRVASVTREPERRGVLLEQLRVTLEAADHSVPASYDRMRLNLELAQTLKVLRVEEDAVPALGTVRTVQAW